MGEDDAVAAVAGIRAWSSTARNPVIDVVRFARSRTLEELQGYAARARRVGPAPKRAAAVTRAETSKTSGPRCTVCGKVEPRCLTERPGPDDHIFTSAERVAS